MWNIWWVLQSRHCVLQFCETEMNYFFLLLCIPFFVLSRNLIVNMLNLLHYCIFFYFFFLPCWTLFWEITLSISGALFCSMNVPMFLFYRPRIIFHSCNIFFIAIKNINFRLWKFFFSCCLHCAFLGPFCYKLLCLWCQEIFFKYLVLLSFPFVF